MSVETTTSKIIYRGDGLNREWPVPFAYNKAEHLKLILKRGYVEEAITANFRVDVNDSGNTSIVYPVDGQPILSDAQLIIYRQTPQTQIVDLQYGGAFSPKVLENDGFDRLQMQIQEMQEHLTRTIALSITDDREIPDMDAYLQQLQERVNDFQKLLDESAYAMNGLKNSNDTIMRNYAAEASRLSGEIQSLWNTFYAYTNGLVDNVRNQLDMEVENKVNQANEAITANIKGYMRLKLISSDYNIQTNEPATMFVNVSTSGSATLRCVTWNGELKHLMSLPIGFAVIVAPNHGNTVRYWTLGSRSGQVGLAA